MAIDPGAYEGGGLLDYVDAAINGMKDDLMPGDLAIIGVVRKSAMAWDLAVADGKMNSASESSAAATSRDRSRDFTGGRTSASGDGRA